MTNALTKGERITYLVTGGAGSLGNVLVDKLVKSGEKIRSQDIYEAGLSKQKKRYPASQYTAIYGSITDYNKCLLAADGVSKIIHTAAMKNLDITEQSIPAMIETNIQGTLNVALAAKENHIDTAILISSDKAVEPTTAYGASKLMGEHIWKWAARIQGWTKYVIVRSGNFFESAGNVFEVWNEQNDNNEPLTLTDPEMERYFIESKELADIIVSICNDPTVKNGDLIVPRMGKWKIIDLLKIRYPNCKYKVTGARLGEKMSESLTYDFEKMEKRENYYIVR